MPSFTPLRRLLMAAALALPLAGCNTILLNAPGDIARQQGNLIIVSTLLMLIIIVPVIALTLFFAWRYRAANKDATYKPDWDHSLQLELVIWAAPLLIIIALGAITWISTHTLDPYRPLDRIAEGRPVPEGTEPLVVEVVALDWKWLFLYPEQGIATVNELAAPVDRPILFKLTSSTVMNAFYVPALAGMIYTMPGMQTELNAVMSTPGDYEGFSSNYSGAGFSGMRFRFHALDQGGFDEWVTTVRAGGKLDREAYLVLEKPSEREPAQHFGQVEGGLYEAILNRCVDPRRMCMHEMMAIDAGNGPGRSGMEGLEQRRTGDLRGRRYVQSAMCASTDAPAPGLTTALYRNSP
ncbi:ubiquinol oxidase subunit II [Pseudoxanthomonas daejeonensis]|uniref:Ubiquinol oxidase subunit 2 n=1 Tax=Pseudoxanthomonas daejeonensis TaxID=266062 RepID=A0ABQ6Z505_9GAMM|nr:ubiquinol oxidase subunit II [Pseudoxanthomonas daejeonensis]KAF1693264.1 ubiquinol oxidase subunit II [Pseudoxanthomonas daejeonensis]UNK57512.1 ubiquinol oxidase subunit II [Pseudoxanthomonas daejeonensis]